jgi:hypothetical protein
LQTLLNQAITDARWDMTYLAMQIIIEGLALAAFNTIRDLAKDPLGRAINAYVMQDEARHVAFGRLALRDYYPHLSDKERDEREEFCVDACYLMRDRFLAEEVWERIGIDWQEVLTFLQNSEIMVQFQSRLFTRIVPSLKEIGLWGPRIQKAFTDMNVLEFASIDLEALAKSDEEVAIEFDRLMKERDNGVQEVLQAA